jgi:phosphopantetheinyl transferase (holo-ACP synthase)
VHKNIPVGIDVEMKREKILRIAHKFTTFVREPNTDIKAEIPRLTHIWAAKETMYKIAGTPGLSFFKDMRVFWLLNHWLIGIIQTAKQEIFYEMHPFEIGDFGGVWGLEIQKASAREGQLKEAFLEAKKNGRVY